LSRPAFLERVRKNSQNVIFKRNIMNWSGYSPELFLEQIEKISKDHRLKFPGGFEKEIGMRGAVSAWEPQDKKGLPRKYSIPSVDTLLKISNLFNVSVDWLLTGEEPKAREISQPVIHLAGRYSELPPGVSPINFLTVPLVGGRIAARNPQAIPPSEIKSWVCVYFPHNDPRRYNDLFAVQVDSKYHAMEPTIRAKDLVVIDPYDNEPVSRGIYAVRLPSGEECNINRIYLSDQYLVISSDNPKYEPDILFPNQAHQVIIGRVLWSWTSWRK
jgi:transcriptional regulator with XRE-family HTH domain